MFVLPFNSFRERESENEHENNLAILSSIDPITTTSTSTGDSECVSKYIFAASGF